MTIPEISRTQGIIATAILSLVATALLVRNLDGTWMHPDTAQALSVARNFQKGCGFKTSILCYDEHYSLNAWPAPQTVFPVGYPAMLAALGWAGIPLRTAAEVIGVTGFFFVPLLICFAAMRMGRTPLTGFLLAVMWLCFPMIWHNVWERQTEMMFISLTLSSLIFLHAELIGYRSLLVAGLLAAVAVSLRYAGVFWLMSVSPVFLMQIPQKRFAAVKQALTFLAIPAIVVALLFARNVILIGDFKGGSTRILHRTLKHAARNAYYAGSRLTGLDKTNLVAGHVAEVAAATGLCLLAISVFICFIRLWNSEYRKRLTLPSIGQTAVYLYIVVSLAALIGLEKTTPINLSPRMLFPMIPFILLACADMVSRTIAAFPDHSHTARSVRAIAVIASVLLIFGVLCGQFRAAEEVRTYVHRFGMVNDIVSQRIETPAGLISPRANSFRILESCRMNRICLAKLFSREWSD